MFIIGFYTHSLLAEQIQQFYFGNSNCWLLYIIVHTQQKLHMSTKRSGYSPGILVVVLHCILQMDIDQNVPIR